MKRLLFFCLFLVGYGGYLDRFSREEGGQTQVTVGGASPESASLFGGVMLYFLRVHPDGTNGEFGRAVGMSNEDLAAGKAVSLPNGTYKTYGLGFLGPNPLGGAVKCAFGNLGNPLSLSGAAVTITFTFSHANCSFGSASVFANFNNAANSLTNRFDDLKVHFCDATFNGSNCSPNASNTTNGVKIRLLGGFKLAGENFDIFEGESLVSNCSGSPAAGAASVNASIPVGSSAFSPPLEVIIYDDSSCTNVVKRRVLHGGPEKFLTPPIGSNVLTSTPVSMDWSEVFVTFP